MSIPLMYTRRMCFDGWTPKERKFHIHHSSFMDKIAELDHASEHRSEPRSVRATVQSRMRSMYVLWSWRALEVCMAPSRLSGLCTRCSVLQWMRLSWPLPDVGTTNNTQRLHLSKDLVWHDIVTQQGSSGVMCYIWPQVMLLRVTQYSN